MYQTREHFRTALLAAMGPCYSDSHCHRIGLPPYSLRHAIDVYLCLARRQSMAAYRDTVRGLAQQCVPGSAAACAFQHLDGLLTARMMPQPLHPSIARLITALDQR